MTPLDESHSAIDSIPDDRTAFDPAAYRTANLDDPELAEAYAVENEAIRADNASFGVAWAFGIVPVALVLMLLSAMLGDWVWNAVPVLFIALVVGMGLLRMGLFHRYASNLPIHLPGLGVYSGEDKRRLLRKAMLVAAMLFFAHASFGWIYPAVYGWVRSW